MGIRVTRENLVSLSALVPYFAFGLVSFPAMALLVLFALEPFQAGAYRHHIILAVLHTAFLGWGSAVALGSLQQLAPVVFGTELHSTNLARWVSIPYVIGVSSLVIGLIGLYPMLLVVGSVLVPASVILTMVNVWLSQSRSSVQAAQRIRPFVRSAMFYFVLTVLAGAALAINLRTNWLGGYWLQVFPGHVTLGLIGWFGMLVLGISYHLLPFFGLTDKKERPRLTNVVLLALHAGLICAWLAGAFTPLAWLFGPISRVILALGAAAFLVDTRSLFRRRPRQKIHPLLTHVRLAHLYLAVVAIALLTTLFASAPKQVVWIGVAGVGGWLSNAILGYLYRILPFYVWHNKYWGRTAEPGVPAFRDMIAEGPAWLGFVLYNAGVLGLLIGLWLEIPLRGYALLAFSGALVSALNGIRTMLR